MNIRIAVPVFVGLTLIAGAAAAHGGRYAAARVVAVEPVYETVVVRHPVRTCRREIVEHRHVTRPSTAGPTLAGAVIGAAVGRQFGSGRGRDVMTVAGAVAGSAVANDRALRRHGGRSSVTIVREPVERCTTRYRRERHEQLTGYWVDYRFRGRRYRVFAADHPGRFIRVAAGS